MLKKLPFEKPKKKKLKSISSLKKKAWRYFSEWTRRRGADSNGYNTCCSCGVKLHWKEGHAGHYLHGHSSQSFLVPENVHFQCLKCNHFLSGNLLEYHKFMLKRYGAEKIIWLENLKHKIWKPSRMELEATIGYYKGLLDSMTPPQEMR